MVAVAVLGLHHRVEPGYGSHGHRVSPAGAGHAATSEVGPPPPYREVDAEMQGGAAGRPAADDAATDGVAAGGPWRDGAGLRRR